MSNIPLRGQTIRNRIFWLSKLKSSLDIEDDRNCCNVLYKSYRGK